MRDREASPCACIARCGFRTFKTLMNFDLPHFNPSCMLHHSVVEISLLCVAGLVKPSWLSTKQRGMMLGIINYLERSIKTTKTSCLLSPVSAFLSVSLKHTLKSYLFSSFRLLFAMGTLQAVRLSIRSRSTKPPQTAARLVPRLASAIPRSA